MKTLIALALAATSNIAIAADRYVVISGGTNVGHVWADTQGNRVSIDFDVKENGRGPTVKEIVTLGTDGLPTSWDVTGTTTFGSKIFEHYERKGAKASWVDASGKGSSNVKGAATYVTQSGSPWDTGFYATQMLKRGNSLTALPGGTLKLEKGDAVEVTGKGGVIPTTAYFVSGIDLDPDVVLLDASGAMVAYVTPDTLVIREGYEADEVRLRGLAAKWSTDRYATIQRDTAHDYKAPVRIKHVRLFDPATEKLTELKSVIVRGRTIAAVMPDDAPSTPGEVTIDGAGGTIVPGFTDMHGHLGQSDALLNVIAGITSVRDMGNDNAVLDELVDRIDRGEIAGPRVIRSGFLEGKSPYNAANGILASSEKEAVDGVRWYAARGYWQTKIYNSIDPKWVPAIVKESHRLGLRVAGHVPAFTNADAMMEAGYDELTHLNQVALQWVLKPGEDTRTLFRITAQQRLPGLDLSSAPVQHTLGLMKQTGVPLDDTLVIHEWLFKSRDGQALPALADVIDHLPIGAQRDGRKAATNPATIGGIANADATWAKLVAIMKAFHDNGTMLLPGTDMGGSFTYWRELELYQTFGMTPPQILKRATWDVTKYLGHDQTLGSVEKGKYADFFLVPGDPTKDLKAIKRISMVVKDGVFYYPDEVYPKFGIKPFVAAPKVTLAKTAGIEPNQQSGGEKGAHFE